MQQPQTPQSNSRNADPIAEIVDVLALLHRLGRPGALLIAPTIGDATPTIASGRPAASRRTTVSAAAVQAARAAGFLEVSVDASGDRFEKLSRSGREALRAALIAEPAVRTPRAQHSRPSRKTAVGSPDATPRRAAERMALVEQLGLRRDSRGKPLLSEPQVSAALRFAGDFAAAHMQPRVTANWSPEAAPASRRRGAPGAGMEMAEVIATAQARVRSALTAVGGGMADLIIDVCCFERGLESIEASRFWPKHAARIVLGFALDRLAIHYGLLVEVSASATRTRQWGEHDFRPTATARLRP